MANDLNVVALVGRLTREIELKYSSGGMALGKFTLASNKGVKRNGKWEDEANFFYCTCFGKTAENLAPYMTKGQQVSIQGSLTQNRWQTPEGQNRSKVEIIVNTVQLIGGKKDDTAKPSQGPPQSHPQQGQPLPNTPENYVGDDLPDYDDPLPF